jgi:hypothetical protein
VPSNWAKSVEGYRWTVSCRGSTALGTFVIRIWMEMSTMNFNTACEIQNPHLVHQNGILLVLQFNLLVETSAGELLVSTAKLLSTYLNLGERLSISSDIWNSLNILNVEDRAINLQINHVYDIFTVISPTYLCGQFVTNNIHARCATIQNNEVNNA